jgi:hypothetical protein
MTVITASDVLPIVSWSWEQHRVVRIDTKIACLPVGKSGWDEWVTGTWQRIERDYANNCWRVELEVDPPPMTHPVACVINSPSRRETPLPREGS